MYASPPCKSISDNFCLGSHLIGRTDRLCRIRRDRTRGPSWSILSDQRRRARVAYSDTVGTISTRHIFGDLFLLDTYSPQQGLTGCTHTARR